MLIRYDEWKTREPEEDEGLADYLENVSYDEFFDVCAEKVMGRLYDDFDNEVIDLLTKHYHDMQQDTP